MKTPIAAVVTALTLLIAHVPSADAGELAVAAGLEGRATSWENDTSASATLRIGYWFTPIIGAYFEGKTGYAEVDERVLQSVDLGGVLRHRFGRVAPFFRLGLIHQHENPREAIDRAPIAVLGGWGDGIRHRAGTSSGVGLDLTIAEHEHGSFYASAEIGSTYFLNAENGPTWYWGGGAAVGLTFDIGGSGRAGR